MNSYVTKGACFAAQAIKQENSSNSTCVIIVPDEKTAYRTKSLMKNFIDGVEVFPSRDLVFHNVSAASMDWEYERIRVLRSVCEGKLGAVITVADAALGFLPPKQSIMQSFELKIGDEVSDKQLNGILESFGYTHSETVEGRGQYSRRGDILDIFIPGEDNPIRMEFFGQELDAAGYFDCFSQRRTENVEKIVITPAREMILDEGSKERIKLAIDKQIASVKKSKLDDNKKQTALEKLEKEKDDLYNGTLYCADKYMSEIFEEKNCLLNYAGGFISVYEYSKVKERDRANSFTVNESVLSLAQSGEINAKNAEFSFDFDYLKIQLCRRPSFIADTFVTTPDIEISGLYSFASKQISPYTRNFEVMCEDLKNYVSMGYKTLIISDSRRGAMALCGILDDNEIKNILLSENESAIEDIDRAGIYVMPMTCAEDCIIFSGFELNRLKRVILTESSFDTGEKAQSGRYSIKKEKKNRILSLSDITEGDYVVHTVHGIARYEGIKTLTAAGVTRDYITLHYAGTDTLYVPTDQLDRISRYAGAAESVKLTKMGSGEWTKTTSRVKKAAKDMAKQLITLYAQRSQLPGYAFGQDTEWQREFEESFEYEETEGQKQAINEIKSDMEKAHPMDRLLCGDVGFGKTEVALRAAFKCVTDGKQCAILVPTTILAWQHYQTLLSRMHGFPVNCDMLSRFKTTKQANEVKAKLKTGEIDIVVGTHALLQKTIEFRDLGLLIVDEEQRFGVAHKERLKEMARQVDVLTLSATPIPRTFNMALVGIRDMSILDEAPIDRYPVQTYVLEYDHTVISEAIKKELRRGGQVFYLYNKVEGIETQAQKIREIVPEANVAVAHGKMDKEQLSEVWRELVEGTIDILVCTTIIETGVDVPNANTLIIENADKLGLSQLHQIRGRVGRSNRRAYAYFTWRRDTLLNEIASKRLEAIREFTEFGSGFKIAMRDLEIRGAGNLLGSAQSGQMEAVGYDMYVKILENAVLEEKGISIKKKEECSISISVDAYIPEIYIKRPAARIEMYKKIAAIENNNDADEVFDEMLDRYGDMPTSVKNLIEISRIRALGLSAGISKIEQKESKLGIYPKQVTKELTIMLAEVFKGRLLLSMGKEPCYNIKLAQSERVCDVAQKAISVFEKYNEMQAQ